MGEWVVQKSEEVRSTSGSLHGGWLPFWGIPSRPSDSFPEELGE